MAIGIAGVVWREFLKSLARERSMAERILPLVEELKTALRMLAQRG